MLTVIIEALGKNGEAQAVALDIIKAFVILAFFVSPMAMVFLPEYLT